MAAAAGAAPRLPCAEVVRDAQPVVDAVRLQEKFVRVRGSSCSCLQV